ncbi:MAG: PSD1 and planctomycete cytochrome C domain-containing protein [Verrucomicrobiota bacterium]
MSCRRLFPILLMAPAWVQPLQAVDFVHEVAPVLKTHCAECHMGTKHKGGLSMNTREDLMKENDDGFVLEPGNSGKSLMMHLINSDDEDERMPPKGDGLDPKEVEIVAKWIDAGAPWEPGFTFKKQAYEPPLKPRRPRLPPAVGGRDHPLDRILDAHLKTQKTVRPAEIDDAAFARRVHLDIIGTLPASASLNAFLSDKNPRKRSILVASLVTDRQAYATHWLSFWNDLLRNDYAGTGYIDGGRKQISNWLYRSLLENKPYDRFATELIAPPAPESAGFANGIKWRGDVSAGQKVPIQYAQSVGQVFLGINLKCASCHDSFTDNWKLTDSYGLAAAFSLEKIEIARCDKPTGKIAEPYWLYPELGKIDASLPPEERLKQVAELTTKPDNGRFSRTIVNRLWHRLMGRGIVHPVDSMSSEPWNEDLLDYLATYLVDQKYDLKKVIVHICESKAYQSKAQALVSDDESKWKYAGPRAKRMTAEQFVDAVWRITGTTPEKPNFNPPVDEGSVLQVRAALMKSDLLLRALGRPNREQIVSSRPNDLTTLEAMDLNNADTLSKLLEQGAQQLISRHGGNTSAMIDDLYLQTLSRPPTGEEKRLIAKSLTAKPDVATVQDLLWSVFVLPEFQLIR